MGATKPRNYSFQEVQLSLTNRALAHPLRIQIMKLIQENPRLSHADIAKILRIACKTAREHIEKLYEGGFILFRYENHHYFIEPNPDLIAYFNFIVQFYNDIELKYTAYSAKLIN